MSAEDTGATVVTFPSSAPPVVDETVANDSAAICRAIGVGLGLFESGREVGWKQALFSVRLLLQCGALSDAALEAMVNSGAPAYTVVKKE